MAFGKDQVSLILKEVLSGGKVHLVPSVRGMHAEAMQAIEERNLRVGGFMYGNNSLDPYLIVKVETHMGYGNLALMDKNHNVILQTKRVWELDELHVDEVKKLKHMLSARNS